MDQIQSASVSAVIQSSSTSYVNTGLQSNFSNVLPQHTILTRWSGTSGNENVYKLKRRCHQSELLVEAKNLYDDQKSVDLTIYCEDGVIHAHQMLLAVASPFLKSLFQSSPHYGVENICIVLPEVKSCLVQALIHFIYTGTVISKEDHFYSLMKLVYALSINASIEAESTNERPTNFGVVGSKLTEHIVLSQDASNIIVSNEAKSSRKVFRIDSAVGLVVPSPSTITSRTMPNIQLPQTPLPINGMAIKRELEDNSLHLQQQQSQQNILGGSSYIAVDPNTGLSYKVDMPNGQIPLANAPVQPVSNVRNNNLHTANVSEDPLAVIMNQTIFTETSTVGNTAVMYTMENGQVVYTTAQDVGLTSVASSVNSNAVVTTAASRKRPASSVGAGRRSGGFKENRILADSVEDMPCVPDDDDINTPYNCETCRRTVKGRVMLQAHMFQEHYENPEFSSLGETLGDRHPCRVCLKIFSRTSDVKAHILRVHCGDRRYPCNLCGKRFKESTHLRKHLFTHTGERPHFCLFCNKGFQTSSDLKRHKRTRVHLERQYLATSNPLAGTLSLQTDAGASTTTAPGIWSEEDEEVEDGNKSPKQAKPGNNAQVLLHNITQPLLFSQSTTTQSTWKTLNSVPVDSKSYVIASSSAEGQWNNDTITVQENDIAGSSTIQMSDFKWTETSKSSDGSKRSLRSSDKITTGTTAAPIRRINVTEIDPSTSSTTDISPTNIAIST